MEGDRDENGIFQRAETRFAGDGRNRNLGQILAEFGALEELEGVDELDGVVGGPKGGSGEVEARLEVETVGALGGSLDFAIKGLSALPAAGEWEAGEFRAAGEAQILASSQGTLAKNAKGRIEPVESWRGREEGH